MTMIVLSWFITRPRVVLWTKMQQNIMPIVMVYSYGGIFSETPGLGVTAFSRISFTSAVTSSCSAITSDIFSFTSEKAWVTVSVTSERV